MGPDGSRGLSKRSIFTLNILLHLLEAVANPVRHLPSFRRMASHTRSQYRVCRKLEAPSTRRFVAHCDSKAAHGYFQCLGHARRASAHPALEKNSVGSALAEVAEVPVAVSASRVLTGSKRARPDMSPDEAGSGSASSKMGSVEMMEWSQQPGSECIKNQGSTTDVNTLACFECGPTAGPRISLHTVVSSSHSKYSSLGASSRYEQARGL